MRFRTERILTASTGRRTRNARAFPILVSGAVLFALTGGWMAHGASVTALANEDIFVHGYRELGDKIRGCKTVDWSKTNNRLLIDKKGMNSYYNIFSVTPEGFRVKPLTFARGGAAARQHSGNGMWSPDGQYFIFTAQNEDSSNYAESMPSIGWHSNIFVADKNGLRYWQLTRIPTSLSSPKGVVMPHISPDGKKLFWAGSAGRGQPLTPWQSRALYMANLVGLGGSRPTLESIQEFLPGKNRDFYEAYGFTPDGSKIIFGGNLETGQPWYGMDLYSLDRAESEPKRLTQTPRIWDRYASISPDGKKIVWASSDGFDIRYLGAGGSRWPNYLRTELWIMDVDGKDPKQLTFFNRNGPRKLAGKRCIVGDTAWSPDGNTIATVIHRENLRRDLESLVVLIDLGKGEPEKPAARKPTGGKRRPAGPKDGTTRPDKKQKAPALKW